MSDIPQGFNSGSGWSKPLAFPFNHVNLDNTIIGQISLALEDTELIGEKNYD
jgi:hypothetical protein